MSNVQLKKISFKESHTHSKNLALKCFQRDLKLYFVRLCDTRQSKAYYNSLHNIPHPLVSSSEFEAVIPSSHSQ